MFASNAFIVAVFCIAATVATPFSACSEGEPVPLALRVKDCESGPCPLYRGESVTAEWDFTVAQKTDNLRPRVMVTVFGLKPVPYPLPEQDACKSLVNGECPLDAGEEVTYGLNMPVHKLYPKVSLGLEFAMVDKQNVVHACFQIKAQVMDK